MRMRRKKWARPYVLERTDVVVYNPESLRGRWREVLGTDRIHLEIGAGKGAYWLQMAQMYPLEGWIAMERSVDAAAMGLKKLEKAPGNMKMILADAAVLDQWFADGEVDVIHLNFPDPWPKKHHEKRRLTSPKFREEYQRILKDGGRVILRTDQKGLYEFSLESMSPCFQLVEKDEDFRKSGHPEEAVTEYEAQFMKEGMPIYRVVWKKEETEKEG